MVETILGWLTSPVGVGIFALALTSEIILATLAKPGIELQAATARVMLAAFGLAASIGGVEHMRRYLAVWALGFGAIVIITIARAVVRQLTAAPATPRERVRAR